MRGFGISLALHAMIALLMWGLPRWWPHEVPAKPIARELIEFEVNQSVAEAPSKTPSPRSQSGTRKGNARAGSRGAIPPKNITMNELLPKYDLSKSREPLPGKAPRIDAEVGPETRSLRRAGPQGDPNYDAHGDGGVYGYSETMDLPKATETMPFFQALWNRVDETMDFPIEIAQMRIGGQVVIHLKVNARGQMVGDFLRVQADHPVLLTYALVMLSQNLKKPLPPSAQLPADHEDVPVALTFDFRVVTLHGLYPRRGGYFKNSLDFSRTRYMDPYALEAIDYVFENYVPPVIPIPGGVYIDFVRAYAMVDNYANDRPDLYTRRERQFNLLRDKLDLAIVRNP